MRNANLFDRFQGEKESGTMDWHPASPAWQDSEGCINSPGIGSS